MSGFDDFVRAFPRYAYNRYVSPFEGIDLTKLNRMKKENQPSMSQKDELDRLKYSRPVGAFGYCAGDANGLSYTAHMTPKQPAKLYRIKRETGELTQVDNPQTLVSSISIDLFGIYAPGFYTTEEEARKAAAKYCEEQSERLGVQAKEHKKTLAARAKQAFQIGETVSYIGKPPFSSYVFGLIKEVTAIRLANDGEGFKYQVNFPGHETTWIPQADLVLKQVKPDDGHRVPTVTYKADMTPPQTKKRGVELIGMKARIKAKNLPHALGFRTIVQTTVTMGKPPTYLLEDGFTLFTREELDIPADQTLLP